MRSTLAKAIFGDDTLVALVPNLLPSQTPETPGSGLVTEPNPAPTLPPTSSVPTTRRRKRLQTRVPTDTTERTTVNAGVSQTASGTLTQNRESTMVNNPGRTRTGQPAQSGHSKRRVVPPQTNAESDNMNEVSATRTTRQYIPRTAGSKEQSQRSTNHRGPPAQTLDSTNGFFSPSYRRYDVPPGWYDEAGLEGTTELKQSLLDSPRSSTVYQLPGP